MPEINQAEPQPSIAPDTTAQQDLVTAGQRRINVIWEATQALIAIMITAAIIFVSIEKIASPEIANAFFLIVGFYFSRTNHANVGGVGAQPSVPYVGR